MNDRHTHTHKHRWINISNASHNHRRAQPHLLSSWAVHVLMQRQSNTIREVKHGSTAAPCVASAPPAAAFVVLYYSWWHTGRAGQVIRPHVMLRGLQDLPDFSFPFQKMIFFFFFGAVTTVSLGKMKIAPCNWTKPIKSMSNLDYVLGSSD